MAVKNPFSPLVVPTEWTGRLREFAIHLSQIITDLYLRLTRTEDISSRVDITAFTVNTNCTYFKRHGNVVDMVVASSAAVSIANDTTLGTIAPGYTPGIYCPIAFYCYTDGKPFNGSVWVEGNELVYYGTSISSKKVIFHATWII